MPVFVLFVSSRSGIICNPSASAITDHSQSANDIGRYLKSQFYVEDFNHRKPVLILRNGRNKPGKRAQNINFCRVWDSNPQTIDRQSSVLPLSYHPSRKSVYRAHQSRIAQWRVFGGDNILYIYYNKTIMRPASLQKIQRLDKSSVTGRSP